MHEDKKIIIEELAEELARSQKVDIYDIELKGHGDATFLRVSIDREAGTVNLGDCERFSRDFAALLDVEAPIEGRYTLEVSSPGLDRALKKPIHFEKSIGKLIKVVFTKEAEGGSMIGRLLRADAEKIVLDVDEEENTIPMGDVKKTRLEPEI
jgi:ribosome maturation factor RimP